MRPDSLLEGVVEEELPRGLFLVRCDDGRRLTASLPIQSRHALTAVIRGTRVRVQISPLNQHRARIVGGA